MNVEEALEKVKRGICCIPHCTKPSELLLSPVMRGVPLFCEEHLLNGELTHAGQYVSKGAYHSEWTCCQNGWKLTACRFFVERMNSFADEIPITQGHLDRLANREAIFEREEEDRRRLEASYHSGHDEYYDR
jgi:hypothetical protein